MCKLLIEAFRMCGGRGQGSENVGETVLPKKVFPLKSISSPCLLNDLYSSPNIVRVIKSRRMR